MISKELITQEEVLIILGNINRQQEIYLEQQIVRLNKAV